MTFNEYVEIIDRMIKDYTKQLPRETLEGVEGTIEESDAGCGKIWLEDYVDSAFTGK